MAFTASHLYFDDLTLGQEWESQGRTVTEADIVNFAGLSGDFNPIHMDHHFAQSTPFRRPIAHGVLVMAIGSGLGTNSPPARTVAFLGVREWKFMGVVFPGDTVRVKTAADVTVDSVTYSSDFPWAISANALGAQDRFTGLTAATYQYKGRSLQRVSVAGNSNDPANWLASPLTGPTPGAAQAVTRSVPKPVVIAKSAVQTSDAATIVTKPKSGKTWYREANW